MRHVMIGATGLLVLGIAGTLPAQKTASGKKTYRADAARKSASNSEPITLSVSDLYPGKSELLEQAREMKAKAESEGTVTYTNANDIMLEAPFNWDAPNYMPKTGSPALTGASFTGLDVFFTNVAYRGALGTTNWMTGWTSFAPQMNTY